MSLITDIFFIYKKPVIIKRGLEPLTIKKLLIIQNVLPIWNKKMSLKIRKVTVAVLVISVLIQFKTG